ncbi:MAG TPA: SBBP repeat-containing protein [Pyrinomonadaceae bacterium]|jgi:hypothetical protein
MRLPAANLRRILLLTVVSLLLTGLLVAPAMLSRRHATTISTNRIEATPPAQLAQAREAYGRIPLSFEANQGQTDASVNFLARGAGYTLFLKPSEAVFLLSQTQTSASAESAARKQTGDEQRLASHADISSAPGLSAKRAVLRMKLVEANEAARVEGDEELAGKVNYLVGDDPSQWRTGVSTYGRVRYAEVYPGIDLVYYGNQRQLEYDFRVAPRSDARAISLRFDGADKVELGADGELRLTLGESVVSQPKPFIYQEVAGARREVEGGYVVEADGRVRFYVGDYDPSTTLVIDPVLVYSTYLGGSSTEDGSDIKVDATGNAYICGQTSSTNFPTASAFQPTFGGATFEGGRDGFVTKLNPTGSNFVYSTYLGGSGDDRCNKIAVDSAGNAYLAGETTSSTDFPRANAYQNTFGGGLSDAFVSKLSPQGDMLVYSTYLGGSIFDAGGGIAVDSAGNAYITGRTTSADFPTTANAIQAAQAGQFADAFVTKLNANGSDLVYSTYLGGSDGTEGGFDAGFSIAVDSTGAAYVTGQTRSTNFPRVNAIQNTFGGGFPDGDAFVTKINAQGTAISYSTYLGGSENDIGFEIAADSGGNTYVTGVTRSSNFPTANAFQSALNGPSDGFLTKISATTTPAFAYSTYFGGSGEDSSNGIAVNASNEPYLALGTSSTNLPTVNPIQAANAGGIDAFIARFNAAGSALIFSTYLGGSGGDAGLSIALDPALSMYVVGRTASTNFPVLSAVQNANGGEQDAFVSKISDTAPGTNTFQFSQALHTVNEEITSVTVTVTRSGDTSAAATVDYATADITASERSDYTTALGTLRFAANETSKTFEVLVNEDSKVEGNELFTVVLSNPTGNASLGAQATTTIQITDDATEPSTNVIDDPGIFVGQHYHDFLNRQADAGGLSFWTGQITLCGADAGCIDFKRTQVSQAFFLSIEFQQTGYLVFRIYKETFTNSPERPRGMPRYREFLRDTQEIQRGVVVGVGNWEQQLAANRLDFARRWVQRADFVAQFPVTMTAAQFVDKLFQNAEVTPTTPERDAAIAAYGSGGTEGRAAALLSVADSASVYNKQYNPAFVLMQYIGYLRRNPNDAPDNSYAGFDFWLNKMNQFSQPGEDVRNEQVARARVQRAEMVRSFIISGEYRQRFGQ